MTRLRAKKAAALRLSVRKGRQAVSRRLAILILPRGDIARPVAPAAIEPVEFLAPVCRAGEQRACPRRRQEVPQIGRASCRESVCQYVLITVVARPLKKTTKQLIENIKSH